jgi:hypothetical protein
MRVGLTAIRGGVLLALPQDAVIKFFESLRYEELFYVFMGATLVLGLYLTFASFSAWCLTAGSRRMARTCIALGPRSLRIQSIGLSGRPSKSNREGAHRRTSNIGYPLVQTEDVGDNTFSFLGREREHRHPRMRRRKSHQKGSARHPGRGRKLYECRCL